MGWLPIETAPKDGTKFIGFDGEYAFITRRGKYYEKFPHQDGGPTYTYKWDRIDTDSISPWNPKYWTTMPED